MDVTVEIKSETFRMCTIQPDQEIFRQQFCQRLAGVLARNVAQHSADFFIRSSDGQNFPVHRCLLMAHSPVFAAMLTHSTKEKQHASCEMDDIDGESVTILRDYVYGCELGNVNRDNAEKILIMADKYAVADLRSFCESMLVNNITSENAAKYLSLAEQRNLDTLKKEVLYRLQTEGTRQRNAVYDSVRSNAPSTEKKPAKKEKRSRWFFWRRVGIPQ